MCIVHLQNRFNCFSIEFNNLWETCTKYQFGSFAIWLQFRGELLRIGRILSPTNVVWWYVLAIRSAARISLAQCIAINIAINMTLTATYIMVIIYIDITITYDIITAAAIISNIVGAVVLVALLLLLLLLMERGWPAVVTGDGRRQKVVVCG